MIYQLLPLSNTHSALQILELQTEGLNTKFYLTYGVRKCKRPKQNIYNICMPQNGVSGWEFEDTKASNTIPPCENAIDVVLRLRIGTSHALFPPPFKVQYKAEGIHIQYVY